jgi:hypothetical protein
MEFWRGIGGCSGKPVQRVVDIIPGAEDGVSEREDIAVGRITADLPGVERSYCGDGVFSRLIEFAGLPLIHEKTVDEWGTKVLGYS